MSATMSATKAPMPAPPMRILPHALDTAEWSGRPIAKRIVEVQHVPYWADVVGVENELRMTNQTRHRPTYDGYTGPIERHNAGNFYFQDKFHNNLVRREVDGFHDSRQMRMDADKSYQAPIRGAAHMVPEAKMQEPRATPGESKAKAVAAKRAAVAAQYRRR